MASAWEELVSQGTASTASSKLLLEHLLQQEHADRAVNYQINMAKLPIHRGLAGFDFSADARLVSDLSSLAFTECVILTRSNLYLGRIKDVKLPAMNFFRTHCSPIAWLLYAVVLFNGLACSVGHGQMMAAFAGNAVASVSHVGDGMSDMHGGHNKMHMSMDDSSKKMDTSCSMKAQWGECSFAGTLTLATIFLVALGWLIRTRSPRFVLRDLWTGKLLRHTLPGLNPQAP